VADVAWELGGVEETFGTVARQGRIDRGE